MWVFSREFSNLILSCRERPSLETPKKAAKGEWSGLGPELAKKLDGFGAMVGAGRWRSGKAMWIGFGT